MIRAVIIDDEPHCVQSLQRDLAANCPDVKVVAACSNAKAGIKAIHAEKPDVVFLDIEMPIINGFELLELVPDIDFEVIFTTAFDQFALQAFKVSAVDYLLKPIDTDALVNAVEKILVPQTRGRNNEQVHFLMQHLKALEENNVKRIALPTFEGLDFIQLDDILYCQSDGSYSFVHLTDGNKIMISKSLRFLEEILCDFQFFRVHKSYIINLDHVSKYARGDGGILIMKNGDQVKVSRSKKEELLNLF